MVIRRSASAFLSSASLSFVVACASTEFNPPRAIVDLSPTITEDLPVRSLGPQMFQEFGGREATTFQHNIVRTPFYGARSYVEVDNHNGAHYDPPSHVIEGAKSGDQVPLDRFFGRAVVIDFRAKPKDQPLLAVDFQSRGIQPDDVVIAFVGYAPPPTGELPSYAFLSGEAAEYLAKLPIKAFATDMPSLGGIKHYVELSRRRVEGSENFLSEHFAFLSREIPAIEGLVNLEMIVNESRVVFSGFPLKIKDANGAPMRAAALIY